MKILLMVNHVLSLLPSFIHSSFSLSLFFFSPLNWVPKAVQQWSPQLRVIDLSVHSSVYHCRLQELLIACRRHWDFRMESIAIFGTFLNLFWLCLRKKKEREKKTKFSNSSGWESRKQENYEMKNWMSNALMKQF